MKLSLKINSGTLAGKTFELQEGALTIGRSENCGIKFDPYAEKIASKQHAFIEKKTDGYYLTDFNSTNGTFLNGLQISTAKLNSGDRIQFGKNGIEATILISESVSQSQLPTLMSPMSEADYRIQNNDVSAQNERSQEFLTQIKTEETVVKPKIKSVGQMQKPTEVFQEPVGKNIGLPGNHPQIMPNFIPPPMNLRNSFSNLGMGGLAQPVYNAPNNTEKNVLIGIAIFAVVFLTLFVGFMIILPNLGFGVAIMATIIAFLPAIFYLMPLIWLDRYDPEPIWLLGLAFAWGALISVIISYKVNTGFAQVAVQNFGVQSGLKITAVISAPIFEEATKGLGVLLLLLFFRRYFDDILDGIVFGGTIALGFATVENIIYYGGAYIGGGSDGLLGSMVLRGIFSPFAHVTFTAMTGIGCGISRESHNPIVRIFMPIMGYCVAVFLHFIWNLMATMLSIEGLLAGDWWYGYLFLQFPFFLVLTCFAFYVMYRQNSILKEMLAIDVARGLIPEEHKKIATSAFRSTAWLVEGIFTGKFLTRNRYLRAVGKLGLSYWHIQRATAARGQTGSFQQNPILRAEVLKWRDDV